MRFKYVGIGDGGHWESTLLLVLDLVFRYRKKCHHNVYRNTSEWWQVCHIWLVNPLTGGLLTSWAHKQMTSLMCCMFNACHFVSHCVDHIWHIHHHMHQQKMSCHYNSTIYGKHVITSISTHIMMTHISVSQQNKLLGNFILVVLAINDDNHCCW